MIPVATRRHFTCGLLCSAGLAGLGGCTSTNPATGGQSFTGWYSLEDDIALGQREHPKLVKAFGGEYESRRLVSYVNRIGFAIASRSELPDLPYRFTIVNSPIVNAFALPGGYVYLSRGLLALASSEAEIAGVLGHEVGHVVARHTAQRLSRAEMIQAGQILLGIFGAATGTPVGPVAEAIDQGGFAYIQGFSREQEFEADTLGIRYMARAGYDPNAVVTFLQTLREQTQLEARMKGLPPGTVDEFNIMATHPRTIERVERAMSTAAVTPSQSPVVGRDVHLDSIDGMLFGDDPDEGVILGRSFLHPGLRFTFAVPRQFRIWNTPRQVIARDGDGALILFDGTVVREGVSMTAYVGQQWAPRLSGVDYSDGSLEPLVVSGLDAATVAGKARTKDGWVDLRLVAVRHHGQRVYRFKLISPVSRTAALNADFVESVNSFRGLSREEADRVRPLRLLVVPAYPDDRPDRLAVGMPFGPYNAAMFRLLNDLRADEPLPDSGRFKIVVS